MSRAVLRKRQSKIRSGGPELCHDVHYGPVGAVPQDCVDPVHKHRLHHLNIAAERRLVQDCAPGGADVDVFPNPEKLHHHDTMTVPGRQKIFNFTS